MPLNVEQAHTGICVTGSRYRIEVVDTRSVRLSVDGRPFADLRVATAVDGPGRASDITSNLSGVRLSGTSSGHVRLSWHSESSLWSKKTFSFECEPERLTYHVEVEGEGAIGAVSFFSGKDADQGPPSLYHFSRFMTSEVTLLDRRYYKSSEYACIDGISGQTSPAPREQEDTNHWIFAPPPFAYAWSNVDGPWLGVGLAPQPGHYNFNLFQYSPTGNCFSLCLTYDGMESVRGRWTSPRIVFAPADDEYSAVKRCADYLYERGLAHRPLRDPAPWWSRPIFCGWGEQNILKARRGGVTQDYARQDVYTRFIDMLDERGLSPGTLIVDDKWQEQYGTLEPDPDKWPDMRVWIDARHAAGQKVLLWIGCWVREGLPDDECVQKTDTGEPVCADPTNARYQDRVRRVVDRLLSDRPGCLGADGFKIDWTSGFPCGEGYRTAGGQWGIELLKQLHSLFYSAAKSAKPDSLIITHAANPYFAEVCDMLRLNDISALQRDVVHVMEHRQKLALIADPSWLIDCDNSSAPTRDEWLRYMKAQPRLGVPSLYFLSGVDGTGEPIRDEDWDEVPDVWRHT